MSSTGLKKVRYRRCHCQKHKCNGALVQEHIACAHEQSELRSKTNVSQAHYKRVGERIVPTTIRHADPVPRGFAIPLHELQPPLSPDVTFKDPRRISESPVEQEMLDYGFLTGEDLDLMTHGTDLPNLGPNFHSPEALHDAVDHFSAYNTATSSGSRPLTSYEAHHLPPDLEQHALDQQIEKAVRFYRLLPRPAYLLPRPAYLLLHPGASRKRDHFLTVLPSLMLLYVCFSPWMIQSHRDHKTLAELNAAQVVVQDMLTRRLLLWLLGFDLQSLDNFIKSIDLRGVDSIHSISLHLQRGAQQLSSNPGFDLRVYYLLKPLMTRTTSTWHL